MASILRVNTLTDASSNNSVPMATVASGSAKSWAHIAAGGASLPDSFNFSSIDDVGTGEYGLNYTSAIGSVNYSANLTLSFGHTSGGNNIRYVCVESKNTSSVEVDFAYSANSVFTSYDLELNASVTIHGDLA